jgi:hypothetical protein
MRVDVEMVYPFGVERGGAALDAMDQIALTEEKFSQVGPILARHSGNQGNLMGHLYPDP